MTDVADRDVNLDGKVGVVTGAGSGLGKSEAIGLARAGASLVVNDLVTSDAVEETLEEIRGLGAKVEFVAGDIGERSTADAIMEAARGQFGSLDILVNNAGITRDRMLFNMSDEDWDLVLKVHLRGHFLLCRSAASYWRGKSKEAGAPVYGRIINTSSEAGLLGPEGQANYGAAKAGITALTLSAARGLSRYGVRANAICPRARTSMTENVFGEAPAEGIDPLSPEHVAALVTYLASPAADTVNGQLFVVYGPMVALMAAPVVERRFDATDSRWTPASLAESLGSYFGERDPAATFSASAALRELG
ncbi:MULTISPECIES: 3-oxoacyl-ACP reductase [Rhodococcus]|uniref:3-oxoacyl-ACP reductase n=1 Tax=Rhodococcus oxybenzonivorans TaxID=1990687 RepID=A0AAE5A809_9NOCA|nr:MULTISPECIES: 3-oxoacyl-ACP reductase [Rhodococcus]MDV7241042.1 3-oxoacyl-ACP reductase [Rhodococcus oxybenzonivorans]MDV7266229.1 3-oxoacyl-ACP reductase [Rhodococcus oxybenzonivorans]MDV7273315.1 3-oxoacyl-ACP reductase [Rhodococcus oxybenzonivorans]MDV7332947.1 3-oxoacyl-ACP reductase [Rhodococcus oxybenzonivorans]MDV7342113.1 3-oxoacyl-ACP reductase [Rhodococcus oxybenzonivorans]